MPENTQDPRERLIAELKRHDWDYDRSDDYCHWAESNARLTLILSLMAQVPDGQALYDQHKPKR